jgi:predicted acetyltransferase
MAEIQLRALRTTDEAAFRAAVRAFKASNPGWDFAFDFDETSDFGAYVRRLDGWTRGEGLTATFVPSTYLIALVDGEIVGRVSIRHVLNDFLQRLGGHVGYGVVAAHRQKGYAREILRQTLPLALGLGIRRLLVTCDDDNVGSYRVIESNGGALENVVQKADGAAPTRRYWIDLGGGGRHPR